MKNHYFEPHEGKNLSDTIGSIAKQAHARGLQKHDVGLESIGDSVKLIRENIKEETKTFKHFFVEVGRCIRPKKNQKVGLILPGIAKFLSIWVTETGKIQGSTLSCTMCTVSTNCQTCR